VKALSLQTRVTLWCALVIGTTLLFVSAGTALFLYREAIADLERQLSDVANRVFAELESEKRGERPSSQRETEMAELLPSGGDPSFFLEVAQGDGALLYRSPSLAEHGLPARAPGFSAATIDGDGVRLGTFTRDGVTVRIAAELDAVEDLSENLATAFLVALPFILGAVFFGGRWASRKALAPVEAITRSAEQVTARELKRRVPVPEAEDPIRRLALVLNETFERLEKNFQQAMRFSADASHELKTPLTVLRSSIETLLRSGSLDAADQRIVAALLEQTKRISSITSGLLLLARADAGKLVIEERTVDLRAVIVACAEDARIVAEASGISLTLTLPESAHVCGDETRLMQIVSNLLDNAVKYNRSRGAVRVALEKTGERWSLKVANTGPGIAPEHQPQVFERFYRAEHSAGLSGHGLGLSLARELARAHGGELTLQRVNGDWTEFQLTLPSRPASPLLAAVSAEMG
jgi:signal transduction histidine kinase